MRRFGLCLLLFGTVLGVAQGQTTDDLIFIHHSVGQDLLNRGLHSALEAKDYIDERNDITYSTNVTPNSGRPSSLSDPEGDYTDMDHWVRWFNDYYNTVKSHGCADGINNIIMFKSCYHDTRITSDGTEPGDPFSHTWTLTNYKAAFRHPDGSGNTYSYGGYSYYALDDVFAAHPDTLFIVSTMPPHRYGPDDPSSDAEALRARTFCNWLKNEWLPDYQTRKSLNNVAVFDLFDVLAYPASHATHPNRLKEEYGGGSGDSHPNETGSSDVIAVLATNVDNFIDNAWNTFNNGAPTYSLVVPFFLDDAPDDGAWPPVMGTKSFIGVKNASTSAATLSVYYRDVSANDKTPTSNTRVLNASSTVSWRPVGDDFVEGAGKDVPNCLPDRVTGSAVVRARQPIAGRFYAAEADAQRAYALPQEWDATTLAVPYYWDDAPADGTWPPVSGIKSFIGIKNLGADPVTLTVTYMDRDNADVTPATNTYILAGYTGISWRPCVDDPAEGLGRDVPNTLAGATGGSAIVTADGPIAGRLICATVDAQHAYVLPAVDDATNGLLVPFCLDNAPADGTWPPVTDSKAFIAVQNVGASAITLTITYMDGSGNDRTPGVNTYILGAREVAHWRPAVNDSIEGTDAAVPDATAGSAALSAQITATGPIVGRMASISSTAQHAYTLSQNVETTTLHVPFYLDNAPSDGQWPPVTTALKAFIGVKNISASPVTLTIIYTDALGNDRTPATNTHLLDAYRTVSWRPAGHDTVEGGGMAVPNATAGNPAGSATVVADGPIAGRFTAASSVAASAHRLPSE